MHPAGDLCPKDLYPGLAWLSKRGPCTCMLKVRYYEHNSSGHALLRCLTKLHQLSTTNACINTTRCGHEWLQPCTYTIKKHRPDRPRRRAILRSSADLCRTIDSLFLLILLPRILLLSFSPIPPILGFDGIFFLQNRATMGDVTFPKIEHAVASVSGVQGRIGGSGSSHLTETCPKLVLIGAGETDATKLELLGSWVLNL
ncbi:hypothetical protein VNO77_33576 [Canavalia gladiata]|uniref:Uncharacterized protein n=1 Tax=Canavalia gladiata TaxID=3824 RepID=A0AAN9KDK5_CANGL